MKLKKIVLNAVSLIAFVSISFWSIGQQLAPADMLTVKRQFIHSTHNKKTYQLLVSLPDGYSPKDTTHYPILYVLDGFYSFPLLASTRVLLEINREIEPLIIVSIADSLMSMEKWYLSRYTDYTPTFSAADDSLVAAEMGIPPNQLKSGGAPAFLATLQNQIIPYIDNQYKTTNDRGIVGHSLGGLFTGYCLVTAPTLFKRYGMNSPSTWWDKKKLFEMEKSFFATNKTLRVHVFMSVGSLEGELMVPSMTSFADSLKQHKYNGLKLTWTIFDQETHLSVVPAMLSRTLRVLYGVPMK